MVQRTGPLARESPSPREDRGIASRGRCAVRAESGGPSGARRRRLLGRTGAAVVRREGGGAGAPRRAGGPDDGRPSLSPKGSQDRRFWRQSHGGSAVVGGDLE